MVCQRLTPKDRLASLKEYGTLLNAPLAVVIITGNSIMDKVKAPATIETPNSKNITKIPSPNNPYTTDGTPARFTIASFIILVSRLSFAYSFKYIAAHTPIGRVTAIAHITIERVPIMAGRIPPPLMPSLGMDVRNSQVMADAPFFMMIKTIMDTGIIASIVTQNKIENAIFWDILGLGVNIYFLLFPKNKSATKFTAKVMRNKTSPMAKSDL